MTGNDNYESVSDEILKPKLKIAKLKAFETWESFCDKKIPVMLNDIVHKLGIPTTGMDLSVDGYTRANSDGSIYILFNKNTSITRQRFTVAHEIGHIVLEHTSIFGDCNQYSKASQEKEADAFAGELLVPLSDLKLFLKTPKSIQEIVDRYIISKEVAFIAIQGNNLLKMVR